MAEIDKNTEQKILDAARKVFTRQGFAAARMDDIAQEAGINRALLHYYFRSKQKLFDVIFAENMGNFYSSFISILGSDADLETKIRNLVHAEIDMLLRNQDLPLFIISEASRNPEMMVEQITHVPIRQFMVQFIQLIHSAANEGLIKPINPIHILMHIMSLCIFPFVGRPVFMHITGTSVSGFEQLMEERKNIIADSVIQLIKK